MRGRKLDLPAIGQRLKDLRKERKLSMRELAAISGVSLSLISKVESGQVAPTVLSLQKLVESMDVELHEFFLNKPTTDPSDQIVFRKADMAISEDEEHRWHIAFPKHPNVAAQLSHDIYRPHSRVIAKISHKSDIFGIVISGELTLEVEGRGVFKVKAGDAYYIKAGVPHRPINNGDKAVKLVNVQLRPTSTI